MSINKKNDIIIADKQNIKIEGKTGVYASINIIQGIMAKIDYAWSKDLNMELTASEAHEKWIMGLISDKTRFECRDIHCHARITCVNMDKQQYQMKMREHFKLYEEHSLECNEAKRVKEIEIKKDGISKSAPPIEEEVTFDISRPENQKETTRVQTTSGNGVETRVSCLKKEKVSRNNENTKRKSHLFLLSTLVSKFIIAKKENRLETVPVKVSFASNQKPYTYTMGSLFAEIGSMSYNADEFWKSKVYYGKARIAKKKENEYWIYWQTGFKENKKIVCCAIKEEVINKAHSKQGALKIIERFLYQEDVYCFAFGTLQESNKAIFININSLDHFACTQDNLDVSDDMRL